MEDTPEVHRKMLTGSMRLNDSHLSSPTAWFRLTRYYITDTKAELSKYRRNSNRIENETASKSKVNLLAPLYCRNFVLTSWLFCTESKYMHARGRWQFAVSWLITTPDLFGAYLIQSHSKFPNHDHRFFSCSGLRSISLTLHSRTHHVIKKNLRD